MLGWKICSKLFRKFCLQKEKTKLFRDSVFISNRIKFLVIVMRTVVFFVIRLIDDDENEDRDCRQIFLHLPLLLKGKVLSVIQFDRSTINFKWLLPQQLIRLNLSSLIQFDKFLFLVTNSNLYCLVWNVISKSSRTTTKLNILFITKIIQKKNKHIKFVYF